MPYEQDLDSYDGKARAVIEFVDPVVDGGENPVKGIEGDSANVTAIAIADGHDLLSLEIAVRSADATGREYSPMAESGMNEWSGSVTWGKPGLYYYTVVARVDHFLSWKDGFKKKVDAEVVQEADILIGAALVRDCISRARGKDADRLKLHLRVLEGENGMPPIKERITRALDKELHQIMTRNPDRSRDTAYPEIPVFVDRLKARYSTWYEIFPRSTASEPGKHGTFRDVIRHLPRIAAMGFDVLYLPPIHPIGTTFRKGKNNSLEASDIDPGSPWAIGGKEGGFKDILPELGSMEDFQALQSEAHKKGIEIALDIAFQCSPDHPYVQEHPEWFTKRPDGTIQYAENPPKKYQDIYPLNFETEDWKSLWQELLSVILFWVEKGVKIFRVDNPHTKSMYFWRWAIAQIRKENPDVILLAEAFTYPARMYHLAKAGFTQSYTYFTWRDTKDEFEQYLQELTSPEIVKYYRPNFWPNTPDILPDHLVKGGKPAFQARLVLAATMSSNYGIYGLPYEQMHCRPLTEGSEEYLNSEKYEIKHWDVEKSGNLSHFISTVNFIRKTNPALHQTERIQFHWIENDRMLAYSKTDSENLNLILTVVSLDFAWKQSGWLNLDPESLGIDPAISFTAVDMLNGETYSWDNGRIYIELDPAVKVAHIFRLEQDK